MDGRVSVHRSITLAKLQEAVESGESIGFCIGCGADQEGVEPDAREYTCNVCFMDNVYGAEQLILEGIFVEE